MSARRSTYDPVSNVLSTGERVVWRHTPRAGALVVNRLPALVLVLLMAIFAGWVTANFVIYAWRDYIERRGVDLFVIAGAGMALFCLSIFSAIARAAWDLFRNLLESWNTAYALTDRRLLIVSRSRVIDYDASYFSRMDAVGKGDAQILMFDWGPFGKRRRDIFRDRIAGLDNAAKLQKLIIETLRPPALEAVSREA